MQKNTVLLLSLLFLTLACRKKTEAEILLNECLKAHGGIDHWKTFEGLSFEMYGEKDTLVSYNQLKDRRTHLIGKDFEVGFDGKDFWSEGNADAGQVKNPAFFHNLDFYFFAMPFVMADPGVKLELEEDAKIGFQNYKVLKAGFGNGVGSAPKDVYKLYIHPKSKELAWLKYCVTYFDSTNTEMSLKRYSNWKRVEGLLLPIHMANFATDSLGQPIGEPHYVRDFDKIKLYEKFDEKLLVPEGA